MGPGTLDRQTDRQTCKQNKKRIVPDYFEGFFGRGQRVGRSNVVEDHHLISIRCHPMGQAEAHIGSLKEVGQMLHVTSSLPSKGTEVVDVYRLLLET